MTLIDSDAQTASTEKSVEKARGVKTALELLLAR